MSYSIMQKSTTIAKNPPKSKASPRKEKKVPSPIPYDDSEIEIDGEKPLVDQTNSYFLSLIHFKKCSLIQG